MIVKKVKQILILLLIFFQKKIYMNIYQIQSIQMVFQKNILEKLLIM